MPGVGDSESHNRTVAGDWNWVSILSDVWASAWRALGWAGTCSEAYQSVLEVADDLFLAGRAVQSANDR
jgi:hypothetical protein